MIAARQIEFGKAAGAKKPYDAEIEYLESTGTQWIDTGIEASWYGLRVELDMKLFNHSGNEVDFFGACDIREREFNYAGHFNNLNGFVLQIGAPYIIYGKNDELRHTHIYDSTNKEVSLDGDKKVYDSWLQGGGTFTIFQRITQNGLVNPSVNNLYGAKFYRDFQLVRDFIPVRKGNVGYMYDRVSGQLFGNQGTGEFVLGPDIIDYTAKDYVLRSPTVFLDGIENAGWGKHENNTTEWQDLSGNNRTAVFKGANIVWNDTNLSNTDGLSNQFYVDNIGLNEMFQSKKFTFELLFKRKSGDYLFFAGNEASRGFWVWSIEKTNCSYTYYQGNNSTFQNKFVEGVNLLTITSDGIYINGSLVKAISAGDFVSTRDRLMIGAYQASGGEFHKSSHIDCDWYRCCAHSESLSAEEIAHNYKIDRARFNLP